MSTLHKTNVSPKVSHNRKHLTPEEARRLITAAGKRGRYPERDRLLVRLTYRHGLRASEAVGMRWSDINLDDATLYVRRAKNGISGTHTLDKDDVRDLRELRRDTIGM